MDAKHRKAWNGLIVGALFMLHFIHVTLVAEIWRNAFWRKIPASASVVYIQWITKGKLNKLIFFKINSSLPNVVLLFISSLIHCTYLYNSDVLCMYYAWVVVRVYTKVTSRRLVYSLLQKKKQTGWDFLTFWDNHSSIEFLLTL